MRVFAAASLGPAMEDAAEAYEARTGTRVRVTAAGSQVLRRQLEAGAPADVYAPASYAHVEGAVRGSLGEVTLLACNRPVVVTGPGSAVRLSALAIGRARVVVFSSSSRLASRDAKPI